MDIDPASLMVRFSGQYSQPCGEPPQESYFQRFDRLDLTMVDRIAPNNGVAASRLGFFHLSPDLKLLSREKTQELFSWPNGQVFATIRYGYDTTYGPASMIFEVRPSRGEIQHEPATIAMSLSSAANELSAISVVRAFRSASGETVAVATYSPAHGDLLNVTGDMSPRVGISMKTWVAFGFPASFSIAAYQANPTWQSPLGTLLSYLTVVNFHYNRNRWVRQDVFVDGDTEPGKHQTRFLEYQLTAQDSMLETADRTLPWGGIDRRRELPSK
ncbi:MAG TPA: hypothetical protein VGG72_24120 [Bryobacteraceae bacterium]|jgi:hypothetical protein